MNFAYKAYNFLITGIFFIFSPPFQLYTYLSGRYREGLKQRLGLYPRSVVNRISGSPRIWLHSASVGEVIAAVAIIESLERLVPGAGIVLSTTTEHGQTLAKDKLRSKAVCIYAPIDFIVSVRSAMSTIKPDILVCIETEIWPNWLLEARRRGVKVAIVNGRVSARSVRGYLKIRPLIREALRQVNAFSMIREEDSERLMLLGAAREKIEVNGNAKYDLLLRQADRTIKNKLEKFYSLNNNTPVFVAGSTRGSEHEIVIDVYSKIVQILPDTLLIIAPRHMERLRQIRERVRKNGFSCQFKTEIETVGRMKTTSVVIMDTIGDLQSTYSIASVVFCGGSLEPLGGQNILEAAVWGKPVFYGPSMEDFMDAKLLLDKTGGGIQVKDGRELAEKTLYYLTHPKAAEAVGKRAKQAVVSNKGAAGKHAAVIHRLLNQPFFNGP